LPIKREMSANETATKMEMEIDLASEPDFMLGALSIRPSSREVTLDGRSEMLEPRVMQVLTALARRRGEVVSRDQLVASCWEGRVVGEDAINRSIAKVRRWSGATTFTLETIPRVGYRLVAAEQVLAATPTSQTASAEPAIEQTPAPEPPRYSLRKKILLTLAGFVAICFAFGTWMGINLWIDTTRPFFAVLQFDNVGDDAAVVSLADAVSAKLNQRLTDQGFRVVSPTASTPYRGARKAEAADDLGARYVIDGSVRLQDQRLRVAVRVDTGSKSMTIWSKEFDVSVDEAHLLPEQISVVLAGLFNPTMQSSPLLPPEVAAGMLRINALRFQGNDMDAYIAAKQLLRDIPMHYTPQVWYATSVAEALDLLPLDLRAAELAAARTAAKTADAMLWGNLPTVYAGLTPMVEWSAREERLRANLDDPYADGPFIRYMLSSQLAGSGRIEEALTIGNQANVMFPLSARIAVGYVSVLDVAGRYREAAELLERTAQSRAPVEFIERNRFTGLISRGDLTAASALLQNPELGPLIDPPADNQPIAALLRALSTRNATDIAAVERDCADPAKLARDRAALCLQGLIALNRLDTFFAIAPAYFPEMRGTTPSAREALWLQAPRVGRYTRVLFRSDAQALRADVRFIPIVERLGLLDYWRSTGKWPDFCKTEPDSVCDQMRLVL
jgi:DNA-binding winged helix-turn-helix (wHTH) protein/TolB-like protein